MDLNTVLTDLGETGARTALESGWEASVAGCPVGPFDFLKSEIILGNRAWCGMPKEWDPLLKKTVRAIERCPALRFLAWHTYRLVFDTAESRQFDAWPGLDHALNGSGGVFYLLLAMAGLIRLRETHRQRGIPESVTRATGSDIRTGANRYGRLSGGRPGVEPRLMSWYRLVVSGDLYRLGRMQYHFRPFRGPLRAYRHRQGGRVLALSEPGIAYDTEGFVAWPGDVNSRTSVFTDSGDHIVGSPICPTGRALPDPVSLDAHSWDCVLEPGVRILGMHIPEGEAMTPDRCKDSMAQALRFFPRYYPDLPFAGFECTSWILNTQLSDMLGANSNLVKYQEELYLFPRPSNGKDGLYFVFDRHEVPLDSAPRNTALRRAYLDHLKAGNRLRNGGMFFLKADFPKFGKKHYRSQWEAALALTLNA